MPRRHHPHPAALAALCLVVLTASCGDDPAAPPGDDPPAGTGPFPATSEQLMANFVAAHENLDAAGYRTLLRDDYVMLAQAVTAAEFPDVGAEIDRTADLAMTARMFDGLPGRNADGDPTAALASLTCEIFEATGPWIDADPSGPFPGTREARFAVSLLLNRPGASTLRTSGILQVWAAARDSLRDGTVQPYWQIAGIRDLTSPTKRAAENAPWASIKALWRP